MTKTKLVLATSNRGKFKEIEEFLADLDLEVLSPEDAGFKNKVQERGQSFLENARLKSLASSLKTKHLVLAEDSGLEIDHLGGQPGIHSARFSAPGPTDEKNIRKILRLMAGVPWDQRRARFVSCLVLAQKGKILKETRGEVHGFIAKRKKGDRGFGYDPIFYYPPYQKNFGELEPSVKNKVSHRGRALRKMKTFLRSYLSQLNQQEGEGG
ncbi:MAG: RdgB/HAM1 family non-canonical purine NTP pyrophosphatase [Candidatus Aminicenantales bacterium]